MKLLLTLAFSLLTSIAPVLAGQLDIAVIQFPESNEPSQLAAAFSEADLATLTNAAKTRTNDPRLRDGSVLFSQNFPAVRGQNFSASTRMSNARSDVSGSLGTGSLEVRISISEGVPSSITGFAKKNFSGSGSLPAGPATIISMRQSTGKAPYVVKGKSKIQHYSFTTVVVAQYR